MARPAVTKTAKPVRPVKASRVADEILTDTDAISDDTIVLYDPQTGSVVGEHRVVNLPGATPRRRDAATDLAEAADALDIEPAERPRLRALRHAGAVVPEKVLRLERTGSTFRLVAIERPPPVSRPRRPA